MNVKRDRVVMMLLSIILPLNFYLIFRFPASNETLVFIGFGVLGAGGLLFVLAFSALAKSRNQGIVTSGIYGVVRNPMYFGGMLMFLSHMLLGQSTIVMVTAIFAAIGCYLLALSEDSKGMEKFGDDYRRYMESVPRFNILAGMIRKLRGMVHK